MSESEKIPLEEAELAAIERAARRGHMGLVLSYTLALVAEVRRLRDEPLTGVMRRAVERERKAAVDWLWGEGLYGASESIESGEHCGKRRREGVGGVRMMTWELHDEQEPRWCSGCEWPADAVIAVTDRRCIWWTTNRRGEVRMGTSTDLASAQSTVLEMMR